MIGDVLRKVFHCDFHHLLFCAVYRHPGKPHRLTRKLSPLVAQALMTELRAEFDERVAAEAAAKAEAAAAAAAAEASRCIREAGRGGGTLVVIDLIVFCELHVSSRFFSGWHRSFKFRTSSSNKDKDKLLVSSGDFSHRLGLVLRLRLFHGGGNSTWHAWWRRFVRMMDSEKIAHLGNRWRH